jgi:hypothetical protein
MSFSASGGSTTAITQFQSVLTRSFRCSPTYAVRTATTTTVRREVTRVKETEKGAGRFVPTNAVRTATTTTVRREVTRVKETGAGRFVHTDIIRQKPKDS